MRTSCVRNGKELKPKNKNKTVRWFSILKNLKEILAYSKVHDAERFKRQKW